jgi:hypothetical protein
MKKQVAAQKKKIEQSKSTLYALRDDLAAVIIFSIF